MITKYYSPEGDGGGIAPEAGADTGTADTTATDTSTGGGNEDGASGDSGGTQTAQPAATMPDFKDIHERAQKGETVPEEHLDAYEQWLSDGMPEQEVAVEPEQTAEPEQPKEPEIPAWQTDAVKMVGAKTPEEVPEKIKGLLRELSVKGAALANYHKYMAGCKSGDPHSIAEIQRVYGFNPATLTAPPAPAAQPAAAMPTQTSEFTKEMFMDEEKGEQFLNAFSSVKNELAAMKENFSKYEQMIEAERAKAEQKQQEAERTQTQSKQMDGERELIEVYGADFGLSNVLARSAIEQLNKNSLGENEILKPFAEFMLLYFGRDRAYEELTPIEFYELKNYRAAKGKIAQAKIDAGKAATSKALSVKPTVGVAGVAQKIAAPNLSDKELEAYYNGTKSIPDEWLDEDGMPSSKMPTKLKSMVLGQAA